MVEMNTELALERQKKVVSGSAAFLRLLTARTIAGCCTELQLRQTSIFEFGCFNKRRACFSARIQSDPSFHLARGTPGASAHCSKVSENTQSCFKGQDYTRSVHCTVGSRSLIFLRRSMALTSKIYLSVSWSAIDLAYAMSTSVSTIVVWENTNQSRRRPTVSSEPYR